MTKRYWFYGTMPSSTVSETELTEEQKKIIKNEKKTATHSSCVEGWLGYQNGAGWDFMKHGYEIIHIDEEKSNVARKMLREIIEEKYGEKKSQEN